MTYLPIVVVAGLLAQCHLLTLSVALTLWGFFKGLYDANIFASVFDVVPPAARGYWCLRQRASLPNR